jgi:2-polyprenyl-3-methyl-5-hydroxy-6-metoxy-1,4-benzoquinol methylase
LKDATTDLGKLGYATLGSQGSRFATFFQHVSIDQKEVLDYGCGLADLLKVGLQLGQLPTRYLGMELTEALSTRAGERVAEYLKHGPYGVVPAEKLTDLGGARFDVVACIGVMTCLEGTREKTIELWKKQMDALWSRVLPGGVMVADFRRYTVGVEPEVVPLTEAEMIKLVERCTESYVLDCSRASHVGTFVMYNRPSFAQRFWKTR